MNITGNHQYTYRTYRRAYRETSGSASRIILWTVGSLVLALVLLLIMASGFSVNMLKPLALILFCFALPELVALLTWNLQRKDAGQPATYELNDEGIKMSTATAETTFTWSGLHWVKVKRHTWLLRKGIGQVLVPRAAFSPEDQAAIDAFLKTAPVKVKS